MKPKRLFRRWERRQRRLLLELPLVLRKCRLQGEAKQIHDLRVTLRRLRLSIRLGRALLPERPLARFRVWAGGISRATSPVRDLDIVVEWLRASKASASLQEAGERRRSAFWRRKRRRLAPLPRGVLGALRGGVRGGEPEAVVGRQVRRLEKRYAAGVARELPRFFALGENDRHEFRRSVRWWRYLREMALPRRKARNDAQLRRLLAVQETTGELQNLALVEAALRRMTPGGEVEELRKLLARQQGAMRVNCQQALAALRVRVR